MVISDSRVNNCFALIKSREGKIKRIFSFALREYFILATEKSSITAFNDFINLCKANKFLFPINNMKPVTFEISKFLWNELNKTIVDFYDKSKH